MSGRILSYHPYSKFPNNDLWIKLSSLMKSITEYGVSIKWIHIPRSKNLEADELCNAILDSREPNHNVRTAEPNDSPLTQSYFSSLLQKSLSIKTKKLYTVPRPLLPLLANVIHHILAEYDKDPISTRIKILLLPSLISIHCSRVQNRHDFKQLRTHLFLLASSESYFNESVHDLANMIDHLSSIESASTITEPSDESARIAHLCAKGRFQQVLRNNNTFVADASAEVQRKTSELFPREDLPTPIPVHAQVIPLSYGEIFSAFRKLKRYKSPSISGWTRELLVAMFLDPTNSEQQNIASFFSDLFNTNISHHEKSYLLSGLLIPLAYKEKPGKIRPIIISDTLVKITWIIALSFIKGKDPNIEKSGHCFSRPGSSQLAIFAIQNALDQGFPVVACDAVNAFNTLKRNSIVEYIAERPHIYSKIYRLFNMHYCSPSTAYM